MGAMKHPLPRLPDNDLLRVKRRRALSDILADTHSPYYDSLIAIADALLAIPEVERSAERHPSTERPVSR